MSSEQPKKTMRPFATTFMSFLAIAAAMAPQDEPEANGGGPGCFSVSLTPPRHDGIFCGLCRRQFATSRGLSSHLKNYHGK